MLKSIHKLWLLASLACKHPVEFYDRIKIISEVRLAIIMLFLNGFRLQIQVFGL